ncbi:MAG: hypothetical protein V3S89_00345 [Desulfobacterales bacterium]
MDASPFVRVAFLENIIEAQIMASILEEQEIPHRIRSFHDTAYDGLFQLQKGWGEIHAPQDSHDDIKKILDDVRKGSPIE